MLKLAKDAEKSKEEAKDSAAKVKESEENVDKALKPWKKDNP